MAAIARLLSQLAQGINWLRSPFALITRLYVGWQFLDAGWFKIQDWEQTLGLFESEYHTPLLPPHVAAYVGTFGEIFFPIILILGIGGRIGALGLSAVNAMAVISYWHVLGTDDFIAGLRQHEIWGFMLAMLAIYGSGALTLDRLWARKIGAVERWE
jgi:putative oxidoreductase